MRNYEKTDVTKSNYALLTELLEEYHPQTYGIATAGEVLLIQETLLIKNRDLISLQNLRDFTVIFLAEKERTAEKSNDRNKMYELMDISSAITSVIDQEKFRLGGEV